MARALHLNTSSAFLSAAMRRELLPAVAAMERFPSTRLWNFLIARFVSFKVNMRLCCLP